ncbi:MAG: SecD/SecF fusion protein [Saprospiraceae bacterium]|jgi:SecD/SecF fusion protein
MQGKGILKFFLILLAVVSALQIVYFFPTNKVEKDAVEYAEARAAKVDEKSQSVERKIAKAQFLDSMSSETIFSIPGISSFTYNDLKSKQLGLGLDLKGGMSAVLQVDLRELLNSLAGAKSKDAQFMQALDRATEKQKSAQSDYITLFADAYKEVAPNKRMAKLFQRSEALGDINLETTDGEVVRMLRTKADETVDLTFKMLKERIDRLGVVQPNVSLDAGRDLILVEMPGVDNAKRMEQNLVGTANLEFWNTYRFTDPGVAAMFQEADKKIAASRGEEVAAAMDTTYNYQYDEDGNTTDSTEVIRPSNDIFSASGPLLSKLQLNGSNGVGLYGTVMGLVDKNKRRATMELLQSKEVKSIFPKNSEFLYSYKPYKNSEGELTQQYELYLIKTQNGTDKAPLEGDVVVEASQQIDPSSGEPEVSLTMNSKGAKVWAKMTQEAYNNGGREIAITLDDLVVSAPGVNNGAITGGRSSISGSFNIQEALDFANILEVGKLPAQTKIIQKSVVGPSLGAQNIASSRNSLLIGFSLLLLFMLFYYGGGGIVSILALFTNIFFIFGTLSSFGTVLTLPGIAGIVLTIGMAVDANVIIFERIREELRAGKSNIASITDGFKASYSAIIDANVTTLLVAAVLAYFGLGPIKGFAVVLIIGVISSMLTAVLFGKLMIDSYTSKNREISFWTSTSKNMFANLNIDWMGKRKIAYIISTVFIVVGLISIFTRGFNLGVDFKGGYSYDISFDKNVTQEEVTASLTSVFGAAPIVKTVDSDNTFQITTAYLIDETDEGTDDQVTETLFEGLKGFAGTPVTIDQFLDTESSGLHITSNSKVGPTIADDISRSSFYAGIFALILIFLYIFIRFNKWQYSMGAVAALFHDSLIVLGLFSLLKDWMPFSLEIDQAFIAAILTVIGYSINDTVVVFDRIREYLGIYTNKGKDEVINAALNSTFSRTIITSFTTLLVVGTLLIFGGGSIKGFAFALLIGVLVGTYSSIFVATPIVRDLSDDLKGTVRAKNSTGAKGGKSFGRAAAKAAEAASPTAE